MKNDKKSRTRLDSKRGVWCIQVQNGRRALEFRTNKKFWTNSLQTHVIRFSGCLTQSENVTFNDRFKVDRTFGLIRNSLAK